MLRDFLEKYEDNIITIVTIFLIILTIVIIIVTWVVGKNYNNEVLNLYENVSYIDQMTEEYKNEIRNLLNTSNIDDLYNKIDVRFLSENSLNENNIREFLLKNNYIGNSVEIISSAALLNLLFFIYSVNVIPVKKTNILCKV